MQVSEYLCIMCSISLFCGSQINQTLSPNKNMSPRILCFSLGFLPTDFEHFTYFYDVSVSLTSLNDLKAIYCFFRKISSNHSNA